MSITALIGTFQLIASLAGNPDSTYISEKQIVQDMPVQAEKTILAEDLYLKRSSRIENRKGLGISYNTTENSTLNLESNLLFLKLQDSPPEAYEKPENLKFWEISLGKSLEMGEMSIGIGMGYMKALEKNPHIQGMQGESEFFRIKLDYRF